jgi:hypothetical protein
MVVGWSTRKRPWLVMRNNRNLLASVNKLTDDETNTFPLYSLLDLFYPQTPMASIYVQILCVIGLVLSLYAIYVEHRNSTKQTDENFTALCDIDFLGASCR